MSHIPDAASPGRSHPTMRHVAALAGVGIKTVSRVVNGEPNVSQTTSDRVREAIERLNYQLDLNAGNLKRATGRALTLGMLVESFSNPFSAAIHRAIELKAWERDTAVIASSLEGDPEREQEILQAFLRRRVDGMILTTTGRIDPYRLADTARRTPLVFIGRDPAIDADAVISDNFSGAAEAARHLLYQGHRRFAFCGIGHHADIQGARERHRGFMDELSRAGVASTQVRVVQDLNDAESARTAVRALLRSNSPPTAIFANQNLVTIGAMRALRECGLQKSVALVGFDDFSLTGLVEPGITVVVPDPERMGRIAAETLFTRIDGSRAEPRVHIVPTKLLERGSGELRATE